MIYTVTYSRDGTQGEYTANNCRSFEGCGDYYDMDRQRRLIIEDGKVKTFSLSDNCLIALGELVSIVKN